jgi:hypothetical protein
MYMSRVSFRAVSLITFLVTSLVVLVASWKIGGISSLGVGQCIEVGLITVQGCNNQHIG